MKLKVGDTVKITAGKDKGREGKIEKLLPKHNSVIVPEVNMYKKHIKGQQGGIKAGMYDIPRPLNLAKVALICPNCKKQTRIGIEVVKKTASLRGEKIRVCRKCKKQI